jgi:hypothetical protein
MGERTETFIMTDWSHDAAIVHGILTHSEERSNDSMFTRTGFG